jgi:ATP-dependent Lhr-like helicase
MHARRLPRPVATAEQFTASLLRRHHLHPDHRLVGPPGVLDALELLQGEDFPVRVWEQDLLAARVEDYQREWLDQLGLAGEIVWTPFEPKRAERARSGRVGVALRENVAWLRPAATAAADLDPRVKNVLLHLQLRGASFAQDVGRVAGLETHETLTALWELFWAGLVTPDTFSAIVAGSTPPRGAQAPLPLRRRPRRGARRAPIARGPVIGRWSALADEEPLSPEERSEAQAHLLLARYGILSRELAHGDWSTLRHTLLRMEYGGEVVRGYFVEGLSGEQYALQEALTELDAPARRAEPHVLVNIADPANLWGRTLTLTRLDGVRATAARIPTTWLIVRQGRPILLVEGQGRSLTPLAGWQAVDFPGAIRALVSAVERPLTLRPVRRLDVFDWDGRPVRESEAFDPLVAAGFTVDGPRLTRDGHAGPRFR